MFVSQFIIITLSADILTNADVSENEDTVTLAGNVAASLSF